MYFWSSETIYKVEDNEVSELPDGESIHDILITESLTMVKSSCLRDSEQEYDFKTAESDGSCLSSVAFINDGTVYVL